MFLSRTLLIALWVWAITWSSYFIPRHRSSRQVFFHQMSPLFSTFATLLLRSWGPRCAGRQQRLAAWRQQVRSGATWEANLSKSTSILLICSSRRFTNFRLASIWPHSCAKPDRVGEQIGTWNVVVVLFTLKWLGCLGTELCEAYTMSFEFCCFCQTLCG